MEDIASIPIIPGAVAILDQTETDRSGIVLVHVATQVTFDGASPTSALHKDQFEIVVRDRDPSRLQRIIQRRARNRAIAYFDGSLGCDNIFADDDQDCDEGGANWFRAPASFDTPTLMAS